MKAPKRIILAGACALLLPVAQAAPIGYSVNADEPLGDRLHAIDLATGSSTEIGPVQRLGIPLRDVEGLAFDPSGTLWGIDENTMALFPLGRANAQADFTRAVTISGLSALSGNDFGMTFACGGTLYISSVADQALYRLDLDGAATRVGSLGANISALAARGNPTRLYGLGNGLLANDAADNRGLYEIDPQTGAATLVGELGPSASDYYQAGLSFDDAGQLWAITDRSGANPLGSEILRLDTATGAATLQATTTRIGFESLAVAPPAACQDATPQPPPAPPASTPSDPVGIPTLDAMGRAAAVLALLLAGLAGLRRHAHS